MPPRSCRIDKLPASSFVMHLRDYRCIPFAINGTKKRERERERERKEEEEGGSIVSEASVWPGIRIPDSVAYRLPLRVVVKQVTYLLLEGNSAPRSIFQTGIPLHKSITCILTNREWSRLYSIKLEKFFGFNLARSSKPLSKWIIIDGEVEELAIVDLEHV